MTLDEYLLLFILICFSVQIYFLCNSTEAELLPFRPDVENSMRFIISAKWVMSQTHAGNLPAWRKFIVLFHMQKNKTNKKTLQTYINISLRSFGEPFKDISNIFPIWTCEHLQPNDEREMFHSIQRANHQSFTFTCSTHNWIHYNTKEELTY